MLLEDMYGDEVEVVFHEDETVEMSILSGDINKRIRIPQEDPDAPSVFEGLYLGGFILDQENAKRLVRRLLPWVKLED